MSAPGLNPGTSPASTVATTAATIAAQQFTRRKALAQQAIAARVATSDQATRKLLPWLAIACRAGADLPELNEALADLRSVQITHGPGAGQYRDVSDAEARALLADEICRPELWRPELQRATGAALRKSENDPACDQTFATAGELLALLRHFGLPLPGPASPENASPENCTSGNRP
jgi:hypothetical protein